MTRVAVASRSFSGNPILRNELLALYPDATFNDSGKTLTGDALVRFLAGHDRAITSLEVLNDSVFDAVPELKVVAKYGVGLDMIDLPAMARRGIRLGWTAGVNRRAVAELVIAFAISLLRHLPQASATVREGGWRQFIGRQLSDRIVGIIGCGHVGQEVARLMRAFGCRVLGHDIRDLGAFYKANAVEPVSLEDLLRLSDVVTIHVPLDASTRNMLDERRLALMKNDAILINAARGGIVDEQALKKKLVEGRIAGAAFDVFRTEPPEDPGLLTLPNFLATPHIGGSSEEAVLAMGRAAIRGLDDNKVPEPGDACWPVVQET